MASNIPIQHSNVAAGADANADDCPLVSLESFFSNPEDPMLARSFPLTLSARPSPFALSQELVNLQTIPSSLSKKRKRNISSSYLMQEMLALEQPDPVLVRMDESMPRASAALNINSQVGPSTHSPVEDHSAAAYISRIL